MGGSAEMIGRRRQGAGVCCNRGAGWAAAVRRPLFPLGAKWQKSRSDASLTQAWTLRKRARSSFEMGYEARDGRSTPRPLENAERAERGPPRPPSQASGFPWAPLPPFPDSDDHPVAYLSASLIDDHPPATPCCLGRLLKCGSQITSRRPHRRFVFDTRSSHDTARPEQAPTQRPSSPVVDVKRLRIPAFRLVR